MKKSTAFVISLLNFTLLNAQSLTDSIIELPLYTIQGMRDVSDSSNPAKQTSFIDRNELSNTTAQSINEVLDRATSIDIRSRGAMDVQSDISIRGGTFDQSLVLIDGVKMSDPQTGHHLMDLPIDMENVEAIEQINNGGSRWFGPYAFSGSVNLITRKAEKSGLSLRLSGGDFGYLKGGINASFVKGKSSTTISLNRHRSDGYIKNTDFEVNNFSLFSTLSLKSSELKINVGQTAKKFGAQNFYTSLFPYQYEETKTQFASARMQMGKKRFRVTPRLYYRRHYDEFHLFRKSSGFYEKKEGVWTMEKDTIPGWYSNPNYHRNDVAGAEINTSYKSKFGQTYIGAEYRLESIISNNLGKKMERTEGKNGAFYDKSDDRRNTSVFFEHNTSIKKWNLSLGMMYNNNSVFGENFFPGADISYSLTKEWSIFAGANRNMRFPTFTDLYYSLGGARGSENLVPETSNNYQFGLKRKNKRLSLSATGFHRQGENLIDWIRLNGSTVTEAANLTNVNFSGVEFDGIYKLSRSPSSFMKGIFLRYTYLTANRKSEGFESNYVLDYLRHKINLGLTHKLYKKVILTWTLNIQDREGGYYNFNEGKEIPFEAFATTDLKLSHELKRFSWYVEASNLFNEPYSDIGNIVQPGRWIRLGFSVKVL